MSRESRRKSGPPRSTRLHYVQRLLGKEYRPDAAALMARLSNCITYDHNAKVEVILNWAVHLRSCRRCMPILMMIAAPEMYTPYDLRGRHYRHGLHLLQRELGEHRYSLIDRLPESLKDLYGALDSSYRIHRSPVW